MAVPEQDSTPTLSDVVAYIDPAVGTARREQLAGVLRRMQAYVQDTVEHWDDVTHYITANWRSEVQATTGRPIKTVRPLWVDHIVKFGSRFSEDRYSPDPAQVFSGCRIYLANVPREEDLVPLAAAVLELGGDCLLDAPFGTATHVVCVHGVTDQTARALVEADQSICAVHVAWLLDSAQTGRRLPESSFALGHAPGKPPPTDEPVFHFSHRFLGSPAASPVRFLDGYSIYLHQDIPQQEMDALSEHLEQAGAEVVLTDEEEVDALLASSKPCVFVFQHAMHSLFLKAHEAAKTVASVYWVYWILREHKYTDPKEHLLYYPFPKNEKKHKAQVTVCITNYMGYEREYLKILVSLVGANYSGDLTQACTHLVTPAARGDKFRKGIVWSTTRVVNHFWLEDSVAALALQDDTDMRYTYVPAVAEERDLGCVGSTPVSADTVRRVVEQVRGRLVRNAERADRQLASLIEGQGFLAIGLDDMPRRRSAATKAQRFIQEKFDLLKGLTADERRQVEASWTTGDDGQPDEEFQPVHSQLDDNTQEHRRALAQPQGATRVVRQKIEVSVPVVRHPSPAKHRPIVPDELATALTEAPQSSSSSSSRAKRPAASLDPDLEDFKAPPPARKRLRTRDHIVIALTQTKGPTSQEMRVLESLNVSVADKHQRFTHLIASRVVKTEKFLLAVCAGAPIVSRQWLEECVAVRDLLDPWQFLLHDDESERRHKFSLRAALHLAQSRKLLAGWAVTATPAVLQSPTLPASTLQRLVDQAGGTVLQHPVPREQATAPDRRGLIVLSLDQDKHEYMRYWHWRIDTVAVYQYGYLSTMLLRQTMEDLDGAVLR